jgi:NAD(P)-dependent dehydrogenase (short-subunit alcohol dehydrogenase family)
LKLWSVSRNPIRRRLLRSCFQSHLFIEGENMASVFITGTSRGIGLEAALAFARKGHKVFATMRNPARDTELAQRAAAEKLPIEVSAMDVDSDESVSSVFAALAKAGERIDVLVNNAGIERAGSVEELPLAEFRAVMETNYFGAIRCIQAVAPQMRERKDGCIINVSSVAGRLSSPPLSSYCASKWALEAMTEGLAGEMKTFNVRVALVEPGIIDTALARRISVDEKKSLYRQGPRFAALFENSLKTPAHPSLVADKILEVAESGTWIMRHPVGPDSIPFLQWRKSMTDEEWAELNGGDDATWNARMARDFGGPAAEESASAAGAAD